MVSKLQLFSIYSFLHVFLDPHTDFHVKEEFNKNIFSFVQMQDNVIYVNPCFKMLMGSKTNSYNDNL
jgi:hypothetical protein